MLAHNSIPATMHCSIAFTLLHRFVPSCRRSLLLSCVRGSGILMDHSRDLTHSARRGRPHMPLAVAHQGESLGQDGAGSSLDGSMAPRTFLLDRVSPGWAYCARRGRRHRAVRLRQLVATLVSRDRRLKRPQGDTSGIVDDIRQLAGRLKLGRERARTCGVEGRKRDRLRLRQCARNLRGRSN
jgi:hypothetical protein